MGRRSSIARLPPEIREAIGRLRNGGRTIEEILAKLRELNAEVSRSALGRHVKQLDAIAADINRQRVLAEAIIARFGDQPDDRSARLNVELLHALLTKLMITEDGDTVSLTPQDAKFIAEAIQRSAAGQKLDADRILKIRQEAAKAAANKAETAVKEQTEKHGFKLPAEALKAIREQVYGIVDRPA
jgi:hypothetical protein